MFDQAVKALMDLLQLFPFEKVAAVMIRNEFNALWCGATLVYFLFFLCLMAARAWPIRSALGRVTRPLRGVDGPEAFAREYETYQVKVRREKRLRHSWQEFTESLIPPREGEPVRIRNTQEPGLFFNDTTVVQPTVHNRFLDTVPSHLVGLGILGTFLGLAAGVGLASGKLDSADPHEVQQALSQLLSGASLAFMTSIIGLGSSLIFLFVERSLVGSVHRRLDRWVTKLEACVELVTPEQIALEQLAQAKRQTKQLESFNDQLVFALEQAFDNAVAQRLAPALESVVRAVEGLRVDRADSNEAVLERLVREFLDKLSQSTGQEMGQIQTTLGTLASRLGEMTESLQGASQGLAAQIAGAGVEIQQSGRTTADGLVAALQPFAAAIDRFERATGAHAELAARIEGLTHGLEGAGSMVVEAHRGFQAALEPSRAIALGMETASGRLASALEQTTRLVEQVAGAAGAIKAEQDKISTAWQEYERRFRNVDEALVRAFQRLDEGVQHYAGQIREFHSEIDQQMSKVIQSLAAQTAELTEAVEDLGERATTLRR